MSDPKSKRKTPGVCISAVVQRGRFKGGYRLKVITSPDGSTDYFSIVSPRTARRMRRNAIKWGITDKHPHPAECIMAMLRHHVTKGGSKA